MTILLQSTPLELSKLGSSGKQLELSQQTAGKQLQLSQLGSSGKQLTVKMPNSPYKPVYANEKSGTWGNMQGYVIYMFPKNHNLPPLLKIFFFSPSRLSYRSGENISFFPPQVSDFVLILPLFDVSSLFPFPPFLPSSLFPFIIFFPNLKEIISPPPPRHAPRGGGGGNNKQGLIDMYIVHIYICK